jgi:hypothetical protein
MRDQAATLSALEVQGQAVNAISARLGATTGQVRPSPSPSPSPKPQPNPSRSPKPKSEPHPYPDPTLPSRSCAPSSRRSSRVRTSPPAPARVTLHPPPRTL